MLVEGEGEVAGIDDFLGILDGIREIFESFSHFFGAFEREIERHHREAVSVVDTFVVSDAEECVLDGGVFAADIVYVIRGDEGNSRLA